MRKKINMKKYKKTAVLFLMAALIGTEAGNINVQARELPEDIESVEDIVTTDAPFESKEDLFRENEMSTESGMSDMEPGMKLDSAPEEVMDGSTINIRCYVDDIISEFEETIFFSVYNETTNKTYDFQLNAVNGYYDNVTLPMGECHIFASIRDNAGTYKLYTDTPAFTLTADPMELVCAYGTDSFIEKQKKIWDGLDVYSQSDTDELLKEAEAAAAGTEMIEETEAEAETEAESDIREEIKPSAVSKKDSEKRNWPAIILAAMMLIIVIVFLVRHIRRNENNPFFK